MRSPLHNALRRIPVVYLAFDFVAMIEPPGPPVRTTISTPVLTSSSVEMVIVAWPFDLCSHASSCETQLGAGFRGDAMQYQRFRPDSQGFAAAPAGERS
jgi:hypothetical protein